MMKKKVEHVRVLNFQAMYILISLIENNYTLPYYIYFFMFLCLCMPAFQSWTVQTLTKTQPLSFTSDIISLKKKN